MLIVCWTAAAAQERVQFPSLGGDNGPSRAPTLLDGYLFRPAGGDRRPAVVFLHACGGGDTPMHGTAYDARSASSAGFQRAETRLRSSSRRPAAIFQSWSCA